MYGSQPFNDWHISVQVKLGRHEATYKERIKHLHKTKRND